MKNKISVTKKIIYQMEQEIHALDARIEKLNILKERREKLMEALNAMGDVKDDE